MCPPQDIHAPVPGKLLQFYILFLPDKVYYVPLEEALQNIANFITKHQPILAQRDPALKKSAGEILEALIKNETQYDKLAQELLNAPKP